MRNRVAHLLIAIIVLLAGNSGAQVKFYQPDTSIKVFAYNREQTLAWCGGFNNPQFTMGDLNNDGLPDLVVFEPWNSVRTFINKGTSGHPLYKYDPKYALNFPAIYNYLILADYNCDGIADLFHQGTSGFEVYRGYYNSSNQLCFAFYQDLLYSNDTYTHGFPVNAFTNPYDIPAIVDVDNDGDLDFIAYDISGGTMNWYKNMRVENGLPCDTIFIKLVDGCWGKAKQGVYRAMELAKRPSNCFACDNSHLHKTPRTGGRVTDGGNTPCLFDWDMDGDYDLLNGNSYFDEMCLVVNGRIETGSGPDSLISQDTLWQSTTGGTQVALPQWPSAFNIDIDQDGKKDLIVAPNKLGDVSENYHCIWYYKNFTTTGHADWRFQSDSFITDMTIDCGSTSYPMLFDYNKDGLPDLFVGSGGYYQADGTMKSRISYYKNTGTIGHPELTLQTNDFLNTSIYGFKGTAIAFGDIDHDGKADLLIGHANGTISYFKNWATSDTVTPIWQLVSLNLTDENGDTITVDNSAAPFIYDMDKDGKKDMIIGNIYGTLVYYQSVSTVPGTIKLKLITQELGHIAADPKRNFNIYSTPFIGKIDSTGIDYLLMGSNSGNIYRFTGFQSGDTSATYTMLDSQFSYIDSTHNAYAKPVLAGGIYDNMRASLTIGDLGHDGSFELILGNKRGGLELFKRKERSRVDVYNVVENGQIQAFPNPANDILNITWSGIIEPNVQVELVNMQGQTIYKNQVETTLGATTISLAGIPNGMYVCQVKSGVNKYFAKVSVVK